MHRSGRSLKIYTNSLWVFIFIVFIFSSSIFLSSCTTKKKIPIRIGYSSLTPIHCHLGEVFSRTNILEKYKLDAKLISFIRGDEQGLAIQEGKIDVTFGCEVPAVLTLVANPEMRIIATPGELGRVALLVPQASKISTMVDMKGKRVGLNEGTTSHKDFIKWVQEASLDPIKDIRIVNLSENEMQRAINNATIDAIVTWDPWVELMIRNNNLKIIRERLFWSVILISQKYIDKYPEGTTRFLSAVKDALFWSSTHQDISNRWVAGKSNWDIAVVETVVGYNKNLSYIKQKGDISLRLDTKVIRGLEECVAFLKWLEIVPRGFNLNDYLNLDFFKKSIQRMKIKDAASSILK